MLDSLRTLAKDSSSTTLTTNVSNTLASLLSQHNHGNPYCQDVGGLPLPKLRSGFNLCLAMLWDGNEVQWPMSDHFTGGPYL